MMRVINAAGSSASIREQVSGKPVLRRDMRSHASRFALLSALGTVAAGASLLVPGQARAECIVSGGGVQCDTTSTTDTTYPVNQPDDREYAGASGAPITLTVAADATVDGNGLAISNSGIGGVTVTNNGMIRVDAGNAPTAGGTAALSLRAAGGPLTYSGGSVSNAGTGNAFDVVQTGAGSIDIDIAGDVFAADGGINVRDAAGSTGISVTVGTTVATGSNSIAIDIQSQSLTGDLTVIADGASGGFRGIDAALMDAAAAGDVAVTATTGAAGRSGIAAQNFGSGSTTVTAGTVTGTSAVGLYARTAGGNISVTAGDVLSDSDTALFADQTGATTGAIMVSAGNVRGAAGIMALNEGTGATSVTASGMVVGTVSRGIVAFGDGAVDVSVAGAVIGATDGLMLIGGSGGSGDIAVSGLGGFVGLAGDAVNILNEGSGEVSIDILGTTTAIGGSGIVVRDTAIGGDIGVTTEAVLALDDIGIDVLSVSLTGDVAIVANGDIAADLGIVAILGSNDSTGDIDVTVNGAIEAGFGIDAVNFGSGSITVTTAGPVITDDRGIYAASVGGDITVNASDDVTSTNQSAITAYQALATGDGAIEVNAGDAAGTTGITAINVGSGAITITASGTVIGALNEGIGVSGEGAVSVSIASTVTGATRGLTLVGGGGGSGDLSVTGGGGFVGLGGDAVNILNDGAGTVTVDIGGAISAIGGSGVFVRDTAIGGDISVNVGLVTASEVGVYATSLGGDVTIAAAGPVTTTENGIYASTVGGDITVTAGDVTSTDAAAIFVWQTQDTGAGVIDVTVGDAAGTSGITAINAGSGATAITVDGIITGTLAEGIGVSGEGAVNISVADTVTGATGGLTLIGGSGGTGDLSVTGTGGFVGLAGDAVDIRNNGAGTVTVDISGATTAVGGAGIRVNDTALGGDMRVTTGAVTALTAGAEAITVWTESDSADVTVIAGGDVRAADVGVQAVIASAGATGNIEMTTNGAVSARLGIGARNDGTGSVTVTALGSVAAGDNFGIYAVSGGGDVTVTAANVSSGAVGIAARQTEVAGSGDVMVNVGNVSAALGIATSNSGAGNTAITVNGTVTGLVTDGITATNAGTGATEIDIFGTVEGRTDALYIFSTADQDVRIRNQGVVRNISGLSSDLAIDAFGGSVDLTNGGSLVGTMNVAATSSIFRNLGSWNSVGGTSLFLGSNDRLINGPAGVVIAGTGAATIDTTIWSELEFFENSGIVRLADGGTGDAIRSSADVVLLNGSVLAVDVGGAGSADLLGTSGTVTIQSGSRLALSVAQPLVLGGQYVVLEAGGGLTGQFDFADQFVTAFLGLGARYTPTTAYVEYGQLRSLADAAITPNQQQTATGADSLPGGNDVQDALLLLPDDAAAQDAFDQLSGEIHPSARTAMVEDSRLPRNAVLARLNDGEPTGAIWGQAFGNWGTSDGDRNAATLRRDTYGFVLGGDVGLGENLTLGLAAAYLDTDLDVRARGSSGSTKTIHGLAYIGGHFGDLRLKAGIGYAKADIDTRRTVAITGFGDTLTADYDGTLIQGFAEMGYRLPLSGGHVEPFANVTMLRARTDAFVESGRAAALAVAKANETSTISTLGVRFETASSGTVSVGGMIGWQHGFGSLDPVGVHRFAGSDPFTILGAAQSRNAGVVNIDARFHLSPAVSVGISYDGVLGTAGQDHAVKGALRVAF